MYHWWFLLKLRQRRIVRAIAAAEKRTSGEIRVFVSHKVCPDPQAEARAKFEFLGMTSTRERNGVLIFIAPRSRNFAIIGDTGIHAKVGAEFWTELACEMSATFHSGKFTNGLAHTIYRAGELLAEHFPRADDDHDELPNKIAHGR